MSLNVGELTAYLTVENSNYRRGLREARGDLNVLAADAKKSGDQVGQHTERMVGLVGTATTRLVRDAQGKLRNSRGQFATAAEMAMAGIDPVAERRGTESGGKLAQGMRQGFIRNSPLIVAGAAAALSAGAPAMISAATGLFAGVGIVAAAQAEDVQSAWLGTWQAIKRGTIAEASAIEPVLIGLADNVADRFAELRPQLGDAFEDAAPQIEVFAGGILDLAENALPGLFRAVERGMPVTQGLADFLSKTGTGLTGFFDAMSEHAPAAGAAFSALGDIMGELLPTLGVLLGQGAELAVIVLPPLASVLGVVADAADTLGPLLPPIALGFAALKIAQTATGWVGGFGDKVASLKSSLTPTNAALGVLAVSVGVAMTAIQDNNDLTQSWVDGLNAGGEAARVAAEEMHAYANSNDDFELIGRWIGENLGLTESVEDVTAAHQKYLDSLTPVQWAQRDVKIATEDLDRAIKDFGRNSPEAAAKLDEYRAATARAEERQAALEAAISGVTEAMAAQRDAVIASFDSQLAYEESLDRLETAQKDYGDAVAEFGSGSEESRDAHRALRDSINATADAFANAQGDVSGLLKGGEAYDEFVRGQFLKSLYMMREEAGPGMKGALDQMITSMQDAGIETQSAAEIAEQFGVQLNNLDGIEASPSVSLEADGFNTVLGGAVGLLNDFGLAKAVPTADLNDDPLQDGYNHDLDLLSILTGQKPTPVANLNDGPFSGILGRVNDRIGTLAGQKPTPVVNANDGPFSGIFGRVMGRIDTLAGQRPTPIASVLDRASGVIGSIQSRIDGMRGNTVTITTIHRQIGEIVGSFGFGNAATGGRVGGLPVHGRSEGGKVDGPGGPTDDRVGPFLGSRALLFFSDDEFVVKARSAVGYGDRKMQAVNDGRAIVMLPEEMPSVRALSGGGTVGSTGAAAPGEHGRVRDVHFHINGVDFSKQGDRRRVVAEIHRELVSIERARS